MSIPLSPESRAALSTAHAVAQAAFQQAALAHQWSVAIIAASESGGPPPPPPPQLQLPTGTLP